MQGFLPMTYRVLIFLLLMAIWVVFSGQLDVMQLALGALSAAFVSAISADLLFANRSTGFGTRIAEGVKLVIYLTWLLWQIVLANLHLLRLSLLPGAMKDVEPSIVKFRTALKSDFARYLLANSITLTPGTVTMKILGDEFYVHSISQASTDGLDGRMEQFIAWIFEDEVEARLGFEESSKPEDAGAKA